jgi:hypothetical protein
MAVLALSSKSSRMHHFEMREVISLRSPVLLTGGGRLEDSNCPEDPLMQGRSL